MSAPIAHMLVGLTLYSVFQKLNHQPRFSWLWAGIFVIATGLPDLDIVPIHLELLPKSTHRTFSHALPTDFVIGVVIATGILIWHSRKHLPRPKHLIWLLPLAVMSHPILDMSCLDFKPPYGTQLLWPFSDQFFYTPLFFMRSVGSYYALGQPYLLSFAKACLGDVLVFGPVLVLTRWVLGLNQSKRIA